MRLQRLIEYPINWMVVMKNVPLLLPLLMLLSGCEQDENYPKATVSRGSSTSTLSVNNGVSLAASDWFFHVGDVGNQSNPNHYQPTRISSTAGTGSSSPLGGSGLIGTSSRTTSYTLGMESSTLKDTASYCYWLASVPPSAALRVGASLTLRAKVRLQDVRGKGVSLVIRGDKGPITAALFATTEGRTGIRGTAGPTEYSVTLPYTTAVDKLIVYLVMLSNTSGSVTFSDVSVQIN